MSIAKNLLRRTQGGITRAVYMVPGPSLPGSRFAPPWCIAGGASSWRPDPKTSATPVYRSLESRNYLKNIGRLESPAQGGG